MKRAFRDALESEGVILELENKKHPDQPPGGRPRTHSNPPSSQSVPTSPRQPRSNALGRSSSDYMLTQAESVFLNDGGQEVSGGLQQKALSSPVLTSTSDANLFPPKFTSSSCEKDEEVIVQRGRYGTLLNQVSLNSSTEHIRHSLGELNLKHFKYRNLYFFLQFICRFVF